jgi:hypothetical protein
MVDDNVTNAPTKSPDDRQAPVIPSFRIDRLDAKADQRAVIHNAAGRRVAEFLP